MSSSKKEKKGSSKSSSKSSSSKSKKDKKDKKSKKKSSKPRRKGIKFNNSVACELIMTLDEYTEEEIYESWYSPEEYADMENECDATATDYLENKMPVPPHLCARGLECWTLEGERSKERNVAAAMDYVWDSQLEHWKRHPPGETKASKDEINRSLEDIAKTYLQISVPCLEAAMAVAKEDERQVVSYLSVAKSIERTRKKMLSLGGATANKAGKRVIRRAPNSARGTASVASKSASKESGYETPDSDSDESAGGGKSKDTTSTDGKSLVAPSTPPSKTGKLEKRSSKASAKNESGPSNNAAKSKKIQFKPKSKQQVPLSPGASINSYVSEVSASKIAKGHRRLSASQSVCSDEGSVRRRIRRSTKVSSSASVT